jgi:hypothetical protein
VWRLQACCWCRLRAIGRIQKVVKRWERRSAAPARSVPAAGRRGACACGP